MRTNFSCTNFLNTPRGPGHPGKIPGTSQIPLFETQGRQTFEGEHELFGHHPFAWKTPTPPGGLRTQKVNLCALFSGLTLTPQSLFFFFFKKPATPEKNKDLPLCRTLKILGEEGENVQKNKEKRKTKKTRKKKQGLEGQSLTEVNFQYGCDPDCPVRIPIRAIFPFFGRFSPFFPGRAKIHFSAIFSYVAPIGAFFCTSVSPINGH